MYCRLSIANKDMEAELVCTDLNGKANGMGPLKDGFLFTHSLGLARKYELCILFNFITASLASSFTIYFFKHTCKEVFAMKVNYSLTMVLNS